MANKKPKPKPHKVTLAQVLEAIRESNGNKSLIAKRLRVSRPTLYGYLRKWATAQEAYDNEVALVLDLVESVVLEDSLVNRNVKTSMWILAHRHPDYKKSGGGGTEDEVRVVEKDAYNLL